jgi:hypothetical protein
VTQIRHGSIGAIAFEESINPILPLPAAFVAHEAHHLLFGRSLSERMRTVRHRPIFGRRGILDRATHSGPAYDNRQRTKPREGTRGGAAASRSMRI